MQCLIRIVINVRVDIKTLDENEKLESKFKAVKYSERKELPQFEQH